MNRINALPITILAATMLLGACVPAPTASPSEPASTSTVGLTQTLAPVLTPTPTSTPTQKPTRTPRPTQTPFLTQTPPPPPTLPPELPLGEFVSDSNTSIAVALDGTVWIGSDGGGITSFDGEIWTTYTTKDGLASDTVWSVVTAPDGTIWAGTWYGISSFDGDTWTTYTTDDGPLSNNVEYLAVAPDGTVWAGSCQGVSRFDGDTWTTYATGDSPTTGRITAIATAPDGSLWAGIDDRGVFRFDGETWVLSITQKDLENYVVRSIFVTSDSMIWVATDGPRIHCFDGDAWKTYHTTNKDERRIYSLVVTPDGAVWTGVGGVRVIGEKDISAKEFMTEAYASPSFIAVAPDDTLWASINGHLGVHHFSGDTWTSYAPVPARDVREQSIHALKAKVATLENVERIEIVRGKPDGRGMGKFDIRQRTEVLTITDPEEIQLIVDGFREASYRYPYWTRSGFYIKLNFYLQDGQVQTLLAGTSGGKSFTAEYVQVVGTMGNDYFVDEYVKADWSL